MTAETTLSNDATRAREQVRSFVADAQRLIDSLVGSDESSMVHTPYVSEIGDLSHAVDLDAVGIHDHDGSEYAVIRTFHPRTPVRIIPEVDVYRIQVVIGTLFQYLVFAVLALLNASIRIARLFDQFVQDVGALVVYGVRALYARSALWIARVATLPASVRTVHPRHTVYHSRRARAPDNIPCGTLGVPQTSSQVYVRALPVAVPARITTHTTRRARDALVCAVYVVQRVYGTLRYGHVDTTKKGAIICPDEV